MVFSYYKFEEWHITSIVYQKFKHVLGCSFPLNPGDKRDVVAELASASSHPAIAKFLSPFPAWSRIMKHIRLFCIDTRLIICYEKFDQIWSSVVPNVGPSVVFQLSCIQWPLCLFHPKPFLEASSPVVFCPNSHQSLSKLHSIVPKMQ